MKNEVVDPFLYDLLCMLFDNQLEISELRRAKRLLSGNTRDSNLDYLTIDNDQFCFAFSALITSMDMNWFMLVGINQNQQPEIAI